MEYIVLDAAAVVQMLNPGKSKTFADYAETVFLPHVHYQLQNVNQLALVWDQYFKNSLKTATSVKRDTGSCSTISALKLV